MKLSEYVEPELVLTAVSPGDVRSVLAQLVEPLVTDRFIPAPDEILDALLAREKVLSTGIGQGVAVPHAISQTLPAPRLIIGICPEGTDYHSVDGQPVTVFFVLVSPPGRANQHIKLLARIARLARHSEFVDALKTCGAPHEVTDHIEHYEREHV